MQHTVPAPGDHGLPIPYGWYCVGYAEDLGPAEVRPVRYFGADWVLYRSAAGRACLAEAFCPHLGAHLGHGGTVTAGGLTCPFHGWQFDEAGRVAAIPYASQLPPRARGEPCLATLPLEERNGILFAWYHPRRHPPLFELASFPELDSGAWTPFEKKQWTIRSHVQETGENAIDTAHFHAVHHTGEVMARPEVRFEGPRRESVIALDFERLDQADDPARVGGRICTANVGPGQTWTRSYGIDLLIIGLPTPIDRHTLELRFACSVPRASAEANTDITRLVIQNAFDQVEQDIPIWEHKIYRPDPLLCDGDGPIAQYRQWFRQFYADDE